MRKIYCLILFFLLSRIALYAQPRIVGNTVLYGDSEYYLDVPIKVLTNGNIQVGNITYKEADFFSAELSIEDDSTLRIGKHKFPISLIGKEQDTKQTVENEIVSYASEEETTEPKDEIEKLDNGIILNKTQCTIIKDGHEYPLHGRIRVVDSFEDIRVRVVDSFEDVRIRIVDGFEGDCYRVRLVNGFEDVRVRIVDSFEDIRVKLVDNYEGISR